MIRIDVPSEQVEVGSVVKGKATWTPEKESEPRAVRVTFGWRTEGKGNRREGTADEKEQRAIAPGSPVTLPFEFTVPLEGPVSYDGKLMKILWEIVVRVDLPFARDEIERKEIRVLPGLYRPENHADDDDDFGDLEDLDDDEEPDERKI